MSARPGAQAATGQAEVHAGWLGPGPVTPAAPLACPGPVCTAAEDPVNPTILIPVLLGSDPRIGTPLTQSEHRGPTRPTFPLLPPAWILGASRG